MQDGPVDDRTDASEDESTPRRSRGPIARRRYLAAAGTTAAAIFAGCLGGGGGGDGSGNDSEDDSGDVGSEDGSNDDGSGDDGGDPPSCGDSLSYRAHEYAGEDPEQVIASVDVPEPATAERYEEGLEVRTTFQDGDVVFRIYPEVHADTTVDELVGSGRGLSERTDQYDLAVSGARVLVPEDDSSFEMPNNTGVYVPDGSDALLVSIDNARRPCESSAMDIYERLIESSAPA